MSSALMKTRSIGTEWKSPYTWSLDKTTCSLAANAVVRMRGNQNKDHIRSPMRTDVFIHRRCIVFDRDTVLSL